MDLLTPYETCLINVVASDVSNNNVIPRYIPLIVQDGYITSEKRSDPTLLFGICIMG